MGLNVIFIVLPHWDNCVAVGGQGVQIVFDLIGPATFGSISFEGL